MHDLCRMGLGGKAGLGEMKGRSEEKQTPFPCFVILLLWTQGETNRLATTPTSSTFVHVILGDLYMPSWLLLHHPLTPVQLLLLADVACANM